jgi:hypothetical protein
MNEKMQKEMPMLKHTHTHGVENPTVKFNIDIDAKLEEVQEFPSAPFKDAIKYQVLEGNESTIKGDRISVMLTSWNHLGQVVHRL